MTNSVVLEFHWSFEQAHLATISDLREFFESAEYTQYWEAKKAKFKALLKTIAGSK